MAHLKKKKISIAAVAAYANVSKSSVSRCLAGKSGVSKQTSKKIRDAAKKSGYLKNIPLSKVMSFIRSGNVNEYETVALVNAKPIRDFSKRYSAISQYVPAAKKTAEKYGYAVCDIWLYEKNFNASKFEKLLFARGIRGGIVFGHYYKDSIPKEFQAAMMKLKFVSMGVKSNAPVRGSVFIDRFLIVKGYVKKIFKLGFSRIGFAIEKFADKYEDGKFSGGFLEAQFEFGKGDIIPPFYWGKSEGRNIIELFEYCRKYKLDALFSYSTDISEALVETSNLGVKLFHYDERFADKDTPRISNQKEVGREAIKMLSDILCDLYCEYSKTNSFEISLNPKWRAQ